MAEARPTEFERRLSAEIDKVFGGGSGTVWRETSRLLAHELGLRDDLVGAISVTDPGVINNRPLSAGLITHPRQLLLITVGEGVGITREEQAIVELIPKTRHLTTVALAERVSDSERTDQLIWRVRRIIDVEGIGIGAQISSHFPIVGDDIRTVPLVAFGSAPAVSSPDHEPAEVSLIDGQRCWLLMAKQQSDIYGDIDGKRYHYPTSIPNGRQLQPGDVIVTARIKTAGTPDAGCITGVGRVGRIVEGKDSTRYAYFDRFVRTDPPINLEDFGDPRSNVNSIVRLDHDWVRRLMALVGIDDINEAVVPFSSFTLNALADELAKEKLVFERSVLRRTVAALRSGKHVMFTGPPGTGKTSLALAAAATASRLGLCSPPMLTTGTADWTSVETVGAYRLARDGGLVFRPGHVVAAIEEDRWLVIDELNRADIDKAIGQLFTVLSGQAVVLPFDERVGDAELPISLVPPGELPPDNTSPRAITRNWRLLATLNDRDRDLLFDMSEALMRRFAIVEVDVPNAQTWREILRLSGGTGREIWNSAIEYLVTSGVLNARPVGPAVVLDAIYHLAELSQLGVEANETIDDVEGLQEAIDLYIRPQLRTIASEIEVSAQDLIQSPVDLAESERPSSDADH